MTGVTLVVWYWKMLSSKLLKEKSSVKHLQGKKTSLWGSDWIWSFFPEEDFFNTDCITVQDVVYTISQCNLFPHLFQVYNSICSWFGLLCPVSFPECKDLHLPLQRCNKWFLIDSSGKEITTPRIRKCVLESKRIT